MMTETGVLDDVLADLRVTGSLLLHETYVPDWAIAVPDERTLRGLLGIGADMRVIPFHLARRGGFALGTSAGRFELTAPELSLVAGGMAHSLSVGRDPRPVDLAAILARPPAPPPSVESEWSTELVCGVFTLRAAPLNPLLGELPPVIRVSTGGEGTPPELAGVAALLGLELGRRTRNAFTVQRLLEVLCAEAIRSYQRGGRHPNPGWFRALSDPKIADALRRLHGAPERDWSVARLAEAAAMSPSRFAARFREAMGESVMTYVARWRMNVACRLLREGDLDITAIARRVGYESVPAFSRTFRTIVGEPPATWRRSTRE